MTARQHAARRESRAEQATLLYDAGCALCESSARWLAARDRHGAFRPVAVDSAEGERALRSAGLEPASMDSVVLILDGRAWTHSSAVIEALRLLGAPWSLAIVARVVPRAMRDAAYRAIAHRRHAWSGRASAGDPGAPGARRG